jgi:isopentenyl-diphosphate delta-isomerase
VGHSDALPVANVNEIAALRYVSPEVLDQEIATKPQTFTPWFKIEWERLRREYPHVLVPSALVSS